MHYNRAGVGWRQPLFDYFFSVSKMKSVVVEWKTNHEEKSIFNQVIDSKESSSTYRIGKVEE